VYKIASISKQFLAAGIMLLVEEGKIGLDDKVSKYLDGTPETWREITIQHLLTHRSGLDDDPPGYDPFKVQADADVIKSAYPMKVLFSPGEGWSYSNVDYFALAEIIHKVSGKPWSEFLTENIFAQAGMLSTRTTTTTDIVPERASGYNWNKGRLENGRRNPALTTECRYALPAPHLLGYKPAPSCLCFRTTLSHPSSMTPSGPRAKMPFTKRSRRVAVLPAAPGILVGIRTPTSLENR
jgi:CubicO group peptidase (beta-lactamase class C family)